MDLAIGGGVHRDDTHAIVAGWRTVCVGSGVRSDWERTMVGLCWGVGT